MSRQKSGHDATELPLRQRCVVVFTVLTCGLVVSINSFPRKVSLSFTQSARPFLFAHSTRMQRAHRRAC